MEQTIALLKLQEADLTILRMRKKLESLPQRKAITENFMKHEAVEEKSRQIGELIAKYEAQVEELQAEDARLADEIDKAKKTIDESRDYRLISIVNRDIEGQLKRRENVEFELTKLADSLAKAEQLAAVASQKLEATEKRDAELVRSFRAAAAEGQAVIDEAQRAREEATAELSAELLERYDELCRNKGGIGASKLEDDHCSVCRITLHEGQLARLKAGPAIGTCPNCRRLIVVHE